MPWDPNQYNKFQTERFAPFNDLMVMIAVRPAMRVLDLGCGTGELTARLADHLLESDVLGVDSSAAMLDEARAFARPNLRFEQTPIEAIADASPAGAWDLVFSHAALQWVDDHESLIPRLFALLAPAGQLAVQVPSNHTHVSHVLIRETASEEPFLTALGGWTRSVPVLSIDGYAAILHAAGASAITAIERVYPHVLADAGAVADWVQGTALVPYLERLPGDLRDLFLSRYREKIRHALPDSPVFYPFRRTLFVASRTE